MLFREKSQVVYLLRRTIFFNVKDVIFNLLTSTLNYLKLITNFAFESSYKNAKPDGISIKAVLFHEHLFTIQLQCSLFCKTILTLSLQYIHSKSQNYY